MDIIYTLRPKLNKRKNTNGSLHGVKVKVVDKKKLFQQLSK